MNKHSQALDIDESVKRHFIIGEAFTATIERVPRAELVSMIEAYVSIYADTLGATFTVPTLDDLRSLALIDVRTTFGRLTATGTFTSSNPFTADRMAAAIFIHLHMFATSHKSFNFTSYEQLASLARELAENWDTATIVIDRED